METADSNKESLAPKSIFVISTFFKVELAVAFLFLSIKSTEGAFLFAVVCGCFNQITEQIYLKRKSAWQKIFFLFASLLVVLLFYFAAYFICGVQLLYHRNGEIKIDISNVRLIIKLVATAAILLGAGRLLAFGGDYFVSRYEQRKNQKGPLCHLYDHCSNPRTEAGD